MSDAAARGETRRREPILNLRSSLAGVCLTLAVLAFGMVAFTQFTSPAHPLSALAHVLDAFAPWLLGLGAVLAGLAAILGARWIGSALILGAAVGGALFYLDYRDVTHPLLRAGDGDFSVLFFNARADNAVAADTIVDAALATDADVVVFAEAAAVRPALDRLRAAYRFVSPCDVQVCEILIATNMTVLRSWREDLNAAWPGRYVVVEFETSGGRRGYLGAVHMVKPWMSGIAEPERARLGAHLRWFDGPVAVVGDFNMAPWSRSMRDMLRATGFRALRGQPASWPVNPGLPVLPIDQVIMRAKMRVDDIRSFGAGLGSNHLGFVADLSLPEPEAP